jgi:2-octaprenyl-6-methoxyphenol hydroxylase
MVEYDVIVVGAGPAGLAAACLIAADGRRVCLVAKQSGDVSDPRTVALMMPSLGVLSRIGLWPEVLKSQTEPLRRLRLVDDTGAALVAPTITFDAAELGAEAFGWNFPLDLLVPALLARTRELGVCHVNSDARSARSGPDHVTVKTSNGMLVQASVVIAADGRGSLLREAAGIRTNSWTYDQAAVVTSFAHSGPHDGMSTEYHKRAGPFTTVPMPGLRSALVWMERPARAAELMALSNRDLATEIQIGTHGSLGRIADIGPRRLFPMTGLVARSFAKNRIVLIGEAAHVVPPIGAQGLNMSFRDAADAAGLIASANDPGAASLLADYDAMRRRDVQPRQQVIDLMNRSLLSGFLPLEVGRAAGLTLLAQFGPLRRVAMRYGLAEASGYSAAYQP